MLWSCNDNYNNFHHNIVLFDACILHTGIATHDKKEDNCKLSLSFIPYGYQ